MDYKFDLRVDEMLRSRPYLDLREKAIKLIPLETDGEKMDR
jgi:hypothetical protein